MLAGLIACAAAAAAAGLAAENATLTPPGVRYIIRTEAWDPAAWAAWWAANGTAVDRLDDTPMAAVTPAVPARLRAGTKPKSRRRRGEQRG